jgi:hypothetical protein
MVFSFLHVASATAFDPHGREQRLVGRGSNVATTLVLRGPAWA